MTLRCFILGHKLIRKPGDERTKDYLKICKYCREEYA